MSTMPRNIFILMGKSENSENGTKPLFASETYDGVSGFADRNNIEDAGYYEILYVAYPTWGLDPNYVSSPEPILEDAETDDLITRLHNLEAQHEIILAEVKKRATDAEHTKGY